MENRVVISTIGTSLLTHQINRPQENEATKQDESNWFSQLRELTNFKLDEVKKSYPEVVEIIQKLKGRAENKLKESDTKTIRRISAELNGIYGFYANELEKGNQDVHWLIATNTAQGIVTAEMIREFLVDKGITNTNIYQSNSNFSTASTDEFSQGIAEIIPWIQELTEGYKSQAKIVFNLVGGFKAVQGYMNTIGMFYADEIIYIFEGSNQLIKIPRLPVDIKLLEVEPYKVPLAMMAQGEVLTSWKEAQKVPKDWVFVVDEEMTLSTWGQLIYQQCKKDLLSSEKLLDLPRLHYQDSFHADYKKIKDNKEKVQLHETLAEVSHKLEKSNGDISVLIKSGIRYDPYEGTDGIDHFRVNRDLRISCKKMPGGKLSLRYYGTKKYVEGKETK